MRLRLFESLRPFSRSGAVRDVLAGVTLASMNIPQVLGYTRIAGTPVVTGLYTVLLPLVAFAAFGSSRHLVVAADSATAAIFSSSLSQMAAPASEKYMALVGMVALLTAGLLLLARILKLGFLADSSLARYWSDFSPVSGFRSAWQCSATCSYRGAVAPHARSGMGALARPAAAQYSDIVSIRARGGKHPARQSCCSALAGFAHRGCRTIAASAAFRFAERGNAVLGPVPGGLPSDRVA